MIHPESIPVFSWRDGFIALKGGGKAGAAGIAHLPADFRNGIGGSFQQPLCLADACFVDIINQLDSRAALKHMGQIGRADSEAVTDHGCAEIGIAGLGMNIIRDLGDVFSNVEAEGVIVIVQLLKAGMDQRNPLLLKLNFRAGIWVHHKRRIADDVIFRHHEILRTQGKGHGGVNELGICLAEV